MARLFTSHDRYHFHAAIGLACVLHFLYRAVCFFLHGVIFPSHECPWVSIGLVSLHGVLSLSSLSLPLPAARNFSAPMIWPEFRFHSILFAMRHVVATILCLCHAWPTAPACRIGATLLLTTGTSCLATFVSNVYGSPLIRTTNGMPYPAGMQHHEVSGIKLAYMDAQFAASKALVATDGGLSFVPLIGIQLAPLLMTLVRKGKIGSMTYHRLYSLALLLGYGYGTLARNDKNRLALLLCGAIPVRHLRVAGVPNFVCWCIFAVTYMFCWPLVEMWLPHEIALYFLVAALLRTVHRYRFLL